MSRFATGVTVITTNIGNDVYGMTANAFMAGSLEPMLCVVSINAYARMHARLLETRRYGVSFLSQWQQHLSTQFAGRGRDAAHAAFVYRAGTPLLDRAVAGLTAEVIATPECGDHTLFIGRITHLEIADRRPLLYSRAAMRRSIWRRASKKRSRRSFGSSATARRAMPGLHIHCKESISEVR